MLDEQDKKIQAALRSTGLDKMFKLSYADLEACNTSLQEQLAAKEERIAALVSLLCNEWRCQNDSEFHEAINAAIARRNATSHGSPSEVKETDKDKRSSKMASSDSLEKAAQAWCMKTTENLVMCPALAEAFAEILDKEKARWISDATKINLKKITKHVRGLSFIVANEPLFEDQNKIEGNVPTDEGTIEFVLKNAEAIGLTADQKAKLEELAKKIATPEAMTLSKQAMDARRAGDEKSSKEVEEKMKEILGPKEETLKILTDEQKLKLKAARPKIEKDESWDSSGTNVVADEPVFEKVKKTRTLSEEFVDELVATGYDLFSKPGEKAKELSPYDICSKFLDWLLVKGYCVKRMAALKTLLLEVKRCATLTLEQLDHIDAALAGGKAVAERISEGGRVKLPELLQKLKMHDALTDREYRVLIHGLREILRRRESGQIKVDASNEKDTCPSD